MVKQTSKAQLLQDIHNERRRLEKNLSALSAEEMIQPGVTGTWSVIESIPEEDMFAHGRYPWTGRLTLADYIAGNTCNHYAWANSQIRKRVKREASKNKKR